MTAVAVAAVLRTATQQLNAAGIESARLDAELLLADALHVDRATLLLRTNRCIDAHMESKFQTSLLRRLRREPIAYILRRREFWSLEFEVDIGVLIPRADSETLIEAAAELPTPSLILDLGTGSGCLLLAALTVFPDAHGMGLDQSEAALAIAQRNAERLGLAARTQWRCGDWADLNDLAPADLILCNPPYIRTGDIAGLSSDVRDYEPVTALDGGTDGLDCYRALLPKLPSWLRPSGHVVFEVGHDQAQEVAHFAVAAGWDVQIRHDLAGVERCLVLTHKISLGTSGVTR